MVAPTDASLVWGLVLAVGLGTLAFRVSFLLLFEYLDGLPPWVERALALIPPAAFAAIALPSVVPPESLAALSPDAGRLLGAAAAALVAWRTENIVATIGAGMAVLVAVRAI